MKNTTIINLFGAPGSGKTTCAVELLTKLKKYGKKTGKPFTVEIVSERAKEVCWTDVSLTPLLQKTFFFEQFNREMALHGSVDFIVTDAPTLVNIFYNWLSESGYAWCDDIERIKRSRVNSLDFFLALDGHFDQAGRWESEGEAYDVERKMKEFVGTRDYIACKEEKMVGLVPWPETFAEQIFETMLKKELI